MDRRTTALLHRPALLRLIWPNLLVTLAQAWVGLIETFWVARPGTDALAGIGTRSIRRAAPAKSAVHQGVSPDDRRRWHCSFIRNRRD